MNDSIGRASRLFRKIGGKGRAMRHRIATYIAKYVGNGTHDAGFNKKRYWTSKGIVLPEVTKYAHLGRNRRRRSAIGRWRIRLGSTRTPFSESSS
ncbi:hypothetical protein [Burkholderia ambifaria]|uniref:hypothetical protein n=1 Tax=Burkholderia ambifaria TaxID=152480 RepID=UPI001E572F0F|nr:hypothetical protein [Burkholderia ambifaria]